MRKSTKVSLAAIALLALAVTYRAPVVDAAINAIKQLQIDLAAGNIPIAASSTTLADGKMLVGNSSGVAAAQTISGDISVSNAGVAAISSGAIVNADINASAAIAFSKFANLSSTKMLVGNASGVPIAVGISGDITVSNAGVTAIGSGKVLKAMLATGVQPSHIVKYAGFANWSGFGKTTYVPIIGALTTDVMLVTPKTAQSSERLVSASVYSNNTAVFTLYTGEVNSKSWQYTIHRPTS